MELPDPDARRIVTPRKPKFTPRGIIVVTRDSLYVERTGESVNPKLLWQLVSNEPSSLLISENFGPHLKRLIAHLGDHPDFNARLTPHYRSVRNDGIVTRTPVVQDVIVNFVGFRASERNHKRALYHYPLDPVHYVRDSITNADTTDKTLIWKLLTWGERVRQFCQDQGMEIRPSAGGLAAQLLRDPRFYPQPRRKCPGLINGFSRPQLPGNYYRLHAETGKLYRATYLDMANAHHAMAARIHFPDVNDLHLYGRPPGKRFYAGPNSDLLAMPGLFHARLAVPHLPRTRFPPPYMESQGQFDIFVYSNELPMVRELGGEIVGLHSAIVSPNADTGLNAYARFAIDAIRERPDDKHWLKPTLHAAYGMLAAAPARFETGYYRAKSGEAAEYPMGPVSIPVRRTRTPREIDPRIANVIHRGMIEAEVRMEALSFARQMQSSGHQVLAIYADSIFVRGDQLSFLPPPWQAKEFCTGLRFLDPTHFISRQLTRMPGLPRSAREGKRRSTQLARYLREIARQEYESRRAKQGGTSAPDAKLPTINQPTP